LRQVAASAVNHQPKRKSTPKKTPELPGVEGPGVSPIEIPEIEKAIWKYQKRKEARCAESPGEIAAKKELRDLLHAHRDQLPVNEDGVPFYRSGDRDYALEEIMRVRRVETETDDED